MATLYNNLQAFSAVTLVIQSRVVVHNIYAIAHDITNLYIFDAACCC